MPELEQSIFTGTMRHVQGKKLRWALARRVGTPEKKPQGFRCQEKKIRKDVKSSFRSWR
jgi:hypothetical protein